MSNDQIKVIVDSIAELSPVVREFTLKAVDGKLTPFSPGSHIIVAMHGADRIYQNAYSLVSNPNDASEYRIAVRLQDESRGGSVFMHDQVQEGSELLISPPANLFNPVWTAKKHVMIAGGIGITPFMSYLPEFERRDADFELHYLYRSETSGAYRDELSEKLGTRYFGYDGDNAERCNIADIFAGATLGTHIYTCGPTKLIEAVQAVANEMGWPQSLIHFEEFAAPKPGIPFTVELKSSGKTVEVGESESLLEALEAADVEVPNLCRGGVCGRCITPVAEGDIEHRDGFLTDDEKSQNNCMMPCVSRSKKERLVLDI